MNARRRRAHDKFAALPGVRPVRRPVRSGSDGRVRPVLRPGGAQVGASAGGHSGRPRCRLGGAVPGLSSARRGRGPGRDHGRAPRRRDVPPRRQRRRPSARSVDNRPGCRRCGGGARRCGGRQGGHLRHLLRNVCRRRIRSAPPRPGACDGPRLTGAVRTRHRCGQGGDPSAAVGRRRPRDGNPGAEGATARRRRHVDAGGH